MSEEISVLIIRKRISKWMYHHVYLMCLLKYDEKCMESNETSGGTDSIVGQHPCQSAVDMALSQSSFKVCSLCGVSEELVRSLNLKSEPL